MNPKEYKYTKEHEWVNVEEDVAIIGITNYAQEQLGDIVSVEFLKIGKEFSKGESLALIDSMKTTSEVYAPISGEILEVNNELDSQPELLNEDPYEKGWILKLKIKKMDELESLMSVEEYEAFVEKEAEGA